MAPRTASGYYSVSRHQGTSLTFCFQCLCFVLLFEFLFDFETESCCVAQAGLELEILLPQFVESWKNRNIPLHLFYVMEMFYPCNRPKVVATGHIATQHQSCLRNGTFHVNLILFLKRGLIMQPWLSQNTQRPTSLCLPRSGTKGMQPCPAIHLVDSNSTGCSQIIIVDSHSRGLKVAQEVMVRRLRGQRSEEVEGQQTKMRKTSPGTFQLESQPLLSCQLCASMDFPQMP